MSSKEELDFILEQWRDIPAIDPQLKHRVWTRIAGNDTPANLTPNYWLSWLVTTLSRPVAAAVFIAACVVCGLGIAELRVSQAKQARTERLAQEYAHLIFPYQTTEKTEVTK